MCDTVLVEIVNDEVMQVEKYKLSRKERNKMNLLYDQPIINHYSNAPNFTGRNVPINEIAEVSGKSPRYIREGLKQGIFQFGYAIRSKDKSIYSYYCPDKLVWEHLGYFNENME